MRRRSFGPYSQVLVNEKSRLNLPTDSDRETQVVLPPGSATPGGGGRDIGKFEYNTPDADSDIKPRTLGIPGEQYGNPSNDTYNTVTRRTMTGFLTIAEYLDELGLEEEDDLGDEEMEESLKKRQKKQKGRSRQDSKRYYKKNKQKIKRYQKQYRKKNKQKIKRYRKKTKGKNRTRRNASVQNVVARFLGVL